MVARDAAMMSRSAIYRKKMIGLKMSTVSHLSNPVLFQGHLPTISGVTKSSKLHGVTKTANGK